MERSTKGAGTVYERRDSPGLWIVERRECGKRTRQSVAIGEAARRWLAVATAKRTVVGSGTLGSWLHAWAAAPKKDLEPRTVDFYRTMSGRWLTSPIAARPLDTLTPEEIEDHLREWVGDLSRTTLGHFCGVLGTALTEAVYRRLITTNPVTTVKLPDRTQPTRVRQIRLGERVIKALNDAWIGTRIAWPSSWPSTRVSARRKSVLSMMDGRIELVRRQEEGPRSGARSVRELGTRRSVTRGGGRRSCQRATMGQPERPSALINDRSVPRMQGFPDCQADRLMAELTVAAAHGRTVPLCAGVLGERCR